MRYASWWRSLSVAAACSINCNLNHVTDSRLVLPATHWFWTSAALSIRNDSFLSVYIKWRNVTACHGNAGKIILTKYCRNLTTCIAFFILSDALLLQWWHPAACLWTRALSNGEATCELWDSRRQTCVFLGSGRSNRTRGIALRADFYP